MRLKIGKKLKTASHNSKFTDSYQTRVNTLCTYYFIVDLQSHSQDFTKGGGLFWKFDTTEKRTWPKFSLVLNLDSGGFSVKIRWSPKKKVFNEIQRFFFGRNQKFKGFFPAEILVISTQKKKRSSPNFKGFFSGRNQKLKGFFSAECGWSPKKKKKKKKKVSTEIQTSFSGRNQKQIQGFFLGRMQVSSNKKRSSPKFKGFFLPKSEIQRVFPAEIMWSPKKKLFTDFGWAPEPKNSTILVRTTASSS